MRHFTIQQEDPQARETRNLTVSRETKFSCLEFAVFWLWSTLDITFYYY